MPGSYTHCSNLRLEHACLKVLRKENYFLHNSFIEFQLSEWSKTAQGAQALASIWLWRQRPVFFWCEDIMRTSWGHHESWGFAVSTLRCSECLAEAFCHGPLSSGSLMKSTSGHQSEPPDTMTSQRHDSNANVLDVLGVVRSAFPHVKHIGYQAIRHWGSRFMACRQLRIHHYLDPGGRSWMILASPKFSETPNQINQCPLLRQVLVRKVCSPNTQGWQVLLWRDWPQLATPARATPPRVISFDSLLKSVTWWLGNSGSPE